MGQQDINGTVLTARSMIQAIKGGSPEMQAKAQQWLVLMMQDPNGRRVIAPLIQEAGLTVMNGQVIPVGTRPSTGMPSTGLSGNPNASGKGGPPNQWSSALNGPILGPDIREEDNPGFRSRQQEEQTSRSNYLPGQPPGAIGTANANIDPMTGQPRTVGSTTPSGGDVRTAHPEWANTFFGGAQSGAIGDLAASPDSAEALWRQRGGPNGGSLANSMASQFGSNDFQSAMQLAPLLGDPNMPMDAGSTLNFADSWMKDYMGAGGSYADPGKILTQALGNIGNVSDPFMQQQMIGDAISSTEPYMDPMSYKMLKNRVARILDEYLAYGVENGSADLQGVLLDQIYAAVGA